MAEDDELDWLREQVDAAFAEVRRAEAVGPALALGLLVGALPMLIFAVAVVKLFVS